jgi:hypothetical protein
MSTNTASASQLYNISRGQIEHNNMSIGLRLIWLNNCLSFMFGIYSSLTLYQSATPFWHTKAQMLSVAIPYIGVCVSLFTLLDVVMGIVRMGNIRKHYQQDGQQEMSGMPMLDGTATDRFFQRLSPVAQSIFYLVIWLYLLLYDKHIF